MSRKGVLEAGQNVSGIVFCRFGQALTNGATQNGC
jgi:hypothetical protein